MLLMISLYTLAARAGIPVLHIAADFGIGLSLANGALRLYRTRSRGKLLVGPAGGIL
jgi:hypothetical protein